MNTTHEINIASPLSPAVSQRHSPDHAIMPGEFAGMYQAGFEAGYEQGRKAGCRQGFDEGIAAIQQGLNNGAAMKIPLEGKPAPKIGPQRMLLGMPCVRCRVYLLSDETHCPCCKQAVRAA